MAEGETRLSPEETKILTREELEQGVRLLCRSTFLTDGTICLPEEMMRREAEIESVGADGVRRSGNNRSSGLRSEAEIGQGIQFRDGKKPGDQAVFDVAADIGTTTVALALVCRRSGEVLAARTLNNSQREYGADVLSRIEAANAGRLEELQRLIWQDILGGIEALIRASGRTGIVGRMVISANTTMEHLFAGDSCETLGKVPFTPVSLDLRRKKSRDIYAGVPERYDDMEVILLPGISAFVGADIVSGMYECGMHESGRPALLLDLGTNGEVALGTKEGLLATSTAAGPALEGGNISCGVPGVPGAISSVSMLGKRLVARTIQNEPPIGLCGTGVLELACEMRKTGIVDEMGAFSEKYRETGFPVAKDAWGKDIVFTQSDVRQLQMAKAAIRSGIELLLKETGMTASALDAVYLAGGLGYKLNVYKAAGIGLIPPALREKTIAVGNSSLSGALRFLKETDAPEKLEELRRNAKEMNLAAHPGFETEYYRHMNFL